MDGTREPFHGHGGLLEANFFYKQVNLATGKL